jgi:hypothetical protein
MDPSVYDMMKTMLAEKAATQSAKKVKASRRASPATCA